MASPQIVSEIRRHPDLTSEEIARKYKRSAAHVRHMRRLLFLAEPLANNRRRSDVLGAIEEVFPEMDPKSVIAHCVIMGGEGAAETVLTILTGTVITRQSLASHTRKIDGFPRNYILELGIIAEIKKQVSAIQPEMLKGKVKRKFTEFVHVR